MQLHKVNKSLNSCAVVTSTLFQTPWSEGPQPLPAWGRRAPKAHRLAWEHVPSLHRDRGQHKGGSTPGRSRPHPHHSKQQSSGVAELSKHCISGLHPPSKLGFIVNCVLCNIFPDSIQKKRMCTKRPTPRCPRYYFPILRSTQDTGRERNAG